MPANVFEVFMAQHPPVGELVEHADAVLWQENALHPVIKERMRIALADAIGCSYCARVRTAVDGELVLDGNDGLSVDERRKAVMAERLATEVVRRDGAPPDEIVAELQSQFSPAEFTDLMFSMSWYIGTQHLGRIMHWDQACPVPSIREMVEAGEVA
jgi:alkylhydroperoxidase family enzyme